MEGEGGGMSENSSSMEIPDPEEHEDSLLQRFRRDKDEAAQEFVRNLSESDCRALSSGVLTVYRRDKDEAAQEFVRNLSESECEALSSGVCTIYRTGIAGNPHDDNYQTPEEIVLRSNPYGKCEAPVTKPKEMLITPTKGEERFEETNCPICLDRHQVSTVVYVSKCHPKPHVFCYHCMLKWIKTNPNVRRPACPICRQFILLRTSSFHHNPKSGDPILTMASREP